ncbi:MAG: hypothetical protein KGQ60_16135, partial [Planctomycetes bacterium]|nr:hypothetical protein [Planctomycetota bacterium]
VSRRRCLMEPNSIVTFADLDETLFSSKLLPTEERSSEPAALGESGEIVSYAAPRQKSLMWMLRQAGAVVPVTARSRHAFSRVLIPFDGYAILSHGAVVVKPDRSVDLDWQEMIKTKVKALSDSLQHLVDEILRSRNSGTLRTWLVKEDGIEVYVVVKGISADCERLESLHSEFLSDWMLRNSGYQIHRKGRHLVVIPKEISKMAAVEYLMQVMRKQTPNLTFVGIGDSDSDFGFMRLCDYMIIPPASQLRDSLIDSWTKTADSSRISVSKKS